MGLTGNPLLRWAVFVGCIVLFPVLVRADAPPWRYDLRPGDHLIYRYSLERQTSGKDFHVLTKATFTTHVLVLGEQNGHLSLGFQRNRESAQLLEYREKGKDTLARQMPDFERRMAKRPTHFAEANEVSPMGEPLDYWEAARESPSKILMAVHEIEALPQKPVAVGETWKGGRLLGLEFRFTGMENVGGKLCARVDGSSATAHLRYWWCPDVGVVGKLEFEGEYPAFGGTVHERMSFELQDKRRGEAIAAWLKQPETQQGALTALLLSRWVPLSANVLAPGLHSSEPETQALALAVLYQRSLEAPDRNLLASLSQSTNVEVKRIAALLLHAPPKANPTPFPSGCAAPASRSHPREKLGTSLRAMHQGPFQGVPYVLHVPKDYRGDQPFPLLIYLSGGAGFAMDGVNTAEDVIAPSGYLVLYPNAGDLWWKPDITARFPALLEEVLQNLNVDTNRVYIAGFSNGGTGAMYYASLWPQRFAAVVSLMGAGVCTPEIAEALPNVTNLPVLLVHGDKDSIISSSCSTGTYEALGKLTPKFAPELHVLKGREHDVTLQNDGEFTLPFLADKVRNPFPTQFAARFADMAYPRHYWVEVVEKGVGVAEIEGEIKPDNSVLLKTKNVKRLRLLLRPEMFVQPGRVRVVLNKKEVFRGELKRHCKALQESSPAEADPLLGLTNLVELEISK